MVKKMSKGRSVEHERKILKAQRNFKKMLERIEPFKVKKDNVSPSTAGKWCNTANLCDEE